MYEVTFLPILIAAIANVVLGMVWFNPKVFGTAWMQGAGITPEKAELGKKRMPFMAFLGLLSGMVIAYVLNHFGIAWGVFDWIGGVELGFWCWAGFTAPVMLGSVLWEMRPVKYYLIGSFYWLVSFILMAVILVAMAA